MSEVNQIFRDVTWGWHICQMYRSAEDLLKFQLPYFRDGLSGNSACIWLVNDPLEVRDARRAIEGAFPEAESALASGKLEIIDGRKHYAGGAVRTPVEAACFWADKEAQKRIAGFDGLRISGNVDAVAGPEGWRFLMEYENCTDAYIHDRRIISLCCYAETALSAPQLADVVSRHQACIACRDGGQWEVIENLEYRRAEAHFERFFALAQDMMGIASLAGRRWLSINNQMLQTLGYCNRELPLVPFVEIAHPDDRECTREAARLLEQDGRLDNFEHRILSRDGTSRWIAWKVQIDQSKGLLYCSGREISERKQAEEELKNLAQRREQLLAAEREARNLAERSSRLKDEFLAVVSHELRTPLNAILGWSQILAAESREPGLQDGLKTITRNARAQAELIEDLLDMSRIVSGKLRLDLTLLSPREFVGAAIETVLPAADAKRVSVSVRYDDGPIAVRGDSARLQQVCWNLLSNAVKFTPENGQVYVTVRKSGRMAEISVRDTGQGIKPEFLPSLFQRFSQEDASTTRAHKGLGLGLSIVKNLVEMHGGEVSAESGGENRGATFTVRLPLEHAAQEGRPAGLAADLPFDRSLDGVRALVIDDERDAAEYMARTLRSWGVSVLTAASVEEAMAAMKSGHPEIVLCDIAMPEEDGYAFIRWMRQLPPEQGGCIGAAAVTAFATAADERRAVEAGFDLHVPKPIDVQQLFSTVQQLSHRAE